MHFTPLLPTTTTPKTNQTKITPKNETITTNQTHQKKTNLNKPTQSKTP